MSREIEVTQAGNFSKGPTLEFDSIRVNLASGTVDFYLGKEVQSFANLHRVNPLETLTIKFDHDVLADANTIRYYEGEPDDAEPR